MKRILFSYLLLLPLFAVSQTNMAVNYYNNLEAVPADYKPDYFKSDKKETVNLLREYIENKDKQLADIEAKVISVNYEMNKTLIDTCIAHKYLNKIGKLDMKTAIDAEAMRFLRQLGYGAELDGKKTYGDLEMVTDGIHDKVTASLDAMNTLKKLGNSTTNVKNDISQAHRRIDTLYGFLYDDGKFKIWITVIFSLIIGSLLIFFFIFINYKTESALAKDFLDSGNGLQFITLFSLIVAIILFGVLGILEGRELAAILSGISGYILGKGITTPKASLTKNKADEHQEAGTVQHTDKKQPLPDVQKLN